MNTTYTMTCLALAGLAAVALTGDALAVLGIAVVAFIAITALRWEAQRG